MLDTLQYLLNSPFVDKLPWVALLLTMEILFFTISLSSTIINRTIAWIDDTEAKQSIFTTFICKITGEKPCDAHWIIFFSLIPLSVLVFFWQLSIWLLLAWGIAYTIRSGRRLQKKITTHIADLSVHKKANHTDKI